MYEGERKKFYGGLAINDRQFLVSSYVTSLTAPDEAPYMTGQFAFDIDRGWMPAIWYEEDFITAYTRPESPIALAREGRLYDASTGRVVDWPDTRTTTQFGAIASDERTLFVAGDNGQFWKGTPGAMQNVPNPFHRPIPAISTSLSEKIDWGQSMQQIYCVLLPGLDEVVVGGARGFLARDTGAGFKTVKLPFNSHVTGLLKGLDNSIYLCGHTPSTFVARLTADNTVAMVFEMKGGPRVRALTIHDGILYLAAPGPNGGVFTLSGNRLERTILGISERPQSAWHLDQTAQTLWIVYEDAITRVERGRSETWTLPDGL
jgi:hypothetical protein